MTDEAAPEEEPASAKEEESKVDPDSGVDLAARTQIMPQVSKFIGKDVDLDAKTMLLRRDDREKKKGE